MATATQMAMLSPPLLHSPQIFDVFLLGTLFLIPDLQMWLPMAYNLPDLCLGVWNGG